MTDRSDMEFSLRLSGKVEQILENYYSGRTSQSMLETRLVLEELTYYLVKKYGGEIDREDGTGIGLVSLIFSKNLKRHTTQETREYMRDINQITLPSLHFNSQAGNVDADRDEKIQQMVMKLASILKQQFGFDLHTNRILQLQQERVMEKRGRQLFLDQIKATYTKLGDDLLYSSVDNFQKYFENALNFIENINEEENGKNYIGAPEKRSISSGIRMILDSDDIRLIKAASEFTMAVNDSEFASLLCYKLARLECPSYVRGTSEQREKSRYWHKKSLKYSKQVQNVSLYIENCRCISHTYQYNKKTARHAIKYLDKGIKAAKKESVSFDFWLPLETDKHQILLKLNKDGQTTKLIQDTLAKSVQNGCEEVEAWCYLNLSHIALRTGDLETCLSLNQDAREIGRKLDDKYILGAANSSIGMLKVVMQGRKI